MGFKTYLSELSEGLSFKNKFKMSPTEADKVAKNYGIKWDKSEPEAGRLWILIDAGKHVMSYNKNSKELLTDFDKSVIDDLL